MPKTVLREKVKGTRRAATTPREWKELCQRALERAQKVGDRRVAGLEKALELNEERETLQALGIVCDADLAREF